VVVDGGGVVVGGGEEVGGGVVGGVVGGGGVVVGGGVAVGGVEGAGGADVEGGVVDVALIPPFPSPPQPASGKRAIARNNGHECPHALALDTFAFPLDTFPTVISAPLVVLRGRRTYQLGPQRVNVRQKRRLNSTTRGTVTGVD
jgi:hypothetical protein